MSRFKLPINAALIAAMFSALMLLAGTGRVHADDVPVIEITAKRFAFIPDKITLKKGQTVKLRLHSQDVTHGLFLDTLKLDEKIPPGETREVTVTPHKTGTFTSVCDHFCGADHGSMNMTVVVE